ncbi:hypothetical protein D9756_009565 [Leucocoprinus leucothites]|uniref:Kinesin motor domain-containing protein n=1 Tax=Leucocoprinus leucothites TaxID=201217 RepID=A0A8H5CV26_9AGAR|nr:hypothetical protein D9756_009565 [Leucoagaricus leucothites]
MASIPPKPKGSAPKRTPSSASTASTSSDASSRLSRSVQPNNFLASTHKRYKAPLSVESRSKNFTKTKSVLSSVPGTPTKRSGTPSTSRPQTPASPRKGAESPSLMPATSEMDVSNVDIESVLVDYQMVEETDISGEIDDAWLEAAMNDHGKRDKVMVSVRVRPSDSISAWNPSPSTHSIQLDPNYAKNTSSGLSPVTFNFDAVLTGSPNKPIYIPVARSHVHAAMEGYNAVIFAYGQTASGKTYTLSGNEEEPGIIPRAMRDVFGFIRQTPTREYLLRCSYLEIYNENIHDLLAPPSMAAANPVQIQGGTGNDVILTPLREEVVTSLKSVREVLKRGEGNRRTACTDWNDRSSRSHSVFRLVIESRERSSGGDDDYDPPSTGRQTPAPNGRQTPGTSGRQTPGPGGPRLQARGGRSVQTSVLSLIDLAGSEKATSDKERTREGKYINTSLLTLGTVIGTLADNAAKRKNDHVPFRNSKLTRMLQPSLSGNARISVICTINPDTGAVGESMSTLQFAKRIKSVQLHAQKKEVVDTDALIERYRKEIEDLKRRLAEREAEAPARARRLSAQEQIQESKVMRDLNNRIKQLTKLILTSDSQAVDEVKGDESRPASPSKIDFDMSPYQLQQELLSARAQLESQANQILSLEAALVSRPPLDASAPENEKDKLIAEQVKTIKELEIVVKGYEENLGEPLRAVKEDVEKEWKDKLEAEAKKREEKERWADELVMQLEKEKNMRTKLEDERRALAAFVSKFDSLGLGLGSPTPTKLRPPIPSPGGAALIFAEKQQNKPFPSASTKLESALGGKEVVESPARLSTFPTQPSLLDQVMPEEQWDDNDADFDADPSAPSVKMVGKAKNETSGVKKATSRDVLSDKENVPVTPAPAARKINELDKQLGKFANECLKLGRVAGLLLAIKVTRELLRRARETFFRNATALFPDLYELARNDSNSKVRDPASEHYFIPSQHFNEPPLSFDVLPTVLEELAQSFSRLHVRIDEFREFTDEGLTLKSLLLTLEHDLLYRRLNTPPIQRYVHQFIDEFESDFDKVAAALGDFTAVGISAISHEQQRSSQNLTNILTVATFFSGVTAGTLAMSESSNSPNTTLHVASMLWFTSLVFSVGAALNSLLAMAWKETRSGSRGGKMPFWVTMWIDGSQLIFLGVSIVTFSAGLVVYAFSSEQARYTPYITVSATGVTFIGLVAISIWMAFEILLSPVLKQHAAVIKSSAESVHSDVSKVPGMIDLSFFPFLHLHRDNPHQDAESAVIKETDGEGSLENDDTESPVALTARLQDSVKSVGLLGRTVSAFISTGRQHKRRHVNTVPRNKLQIDTSVSSTPMTQLSLPSQPSLIVDLARYGTIRDIAYSGDGKWLAVTWRTIASRGLLFMMQRHFYFPSSARIRLTSEQNLASYMDTWHEGRAISERLIWSPSSTKLIVKFEHRFDVWDLDAKNLQMVERHHQVQGVDWCGEDSFLVAEHSCVFKMNLTRVMAVYHFEHMLVRSIALERKNNYLIVITRVAKSPEQFEPASGRSEKRIVIYDMDTQEAIYQVPVLENISHIYPVVGELDLLITHKDQKAFQLWSLDAGLKGSTDPTQRTAITARLKKRTVTSHMNSGDYIGPTCIGGNYGQFILCGTSSGAIDIWRRETGMPHQRFEHQIFREEGLRCLSWRRRKDTTATFATAGEDSHALYIWQGEEPILPRSPIPLDPFSHLPGSKSPTTSTWARLQHITASTQSDVPLSLSPSSSRELELDEETARNSTPKSETTANRGVLVLLPPVNH